MIFECAAVPQTILWQFQKKTKTHRFLSKMVAFFFSQVLMFHIYIIYTVIHQVLTVVVHISMFMENF